MFESHSGLCDSPLPCHRVLVLHFRQVLMVALGAPTPSAALWRTRVALLCPAAVILRPPSTLPLVFATEGREAVAVMQPTAGNSLRLGESRAQCERSARGARHSI